MDSDCKVPNITVFNIFVDFKGGFLDCFLNGEWSKREFLKQFDCCLSLSDAASNLENCAWNMRTIDCLKIQESPNFCFSSLHDTFICLVFGSADEFIYPIFASAGGSICPVFTSGGELSNSSVRFASQSVCRHGSTL